jgi:hypothetical protein
MVVFFLLLLAVIVVNTAIASSSSSNFVLAGFQIRTPQNNYNNNNQSSRRDVLLTTIATTTTTSASSLLFLLQQPQPVQAKDESMNYQAVWFDPKHPNGYRVLFGNDQKATLLLRNEPSDDELVFPVKVIKEGEGGGETKLLFYFGSSSGSGDDHESRRSGGGGGGPAAAATEVVEGIFTRNREKIRIISFDNNNNNFWMNKKFEGPIGVYKDNTNSKRVIIIRQIKGSDCVVEFRDDGDNTVTSTFTAKAGNTFTFYFPDDRGAVTATFSLFRRTLTFDDGTVWTKY